MLNRTLRPEHVTKAVVEKQ